MCTQYDPAFVKRVLDGVLAGDVDNFADHAHHIFGVDVKSALGDPTDGRFQIRLDEFKARQLQQMTTCFLCAANCNGNLALPNEHEREFYVIPVFLSVSARFLKQPELKERWKEALPKFEERWPVYMGVLRKKFYGRLGTLEAYIEGVTNADEVYLLMDKVRRSFHEAEEMLPDVQRCLELVDF
jgi:hypothetical protein